MPRQRSEDRWERWVAEVLKGRNLLEPPPASLRRALALGADLPGRKAVALTRLAHLVFDSSTEPLPAGVRGAGAGERRLLYQVRDEAAPEGSTQIDLRLRRESGGTVELTGQVLPPLPGTWIEARSARSRRRRRLGADGEFLFRGLPAYGRSLHLEIQRGSHATVVIEDVPLFRATDQDD